MTETEVQFILELIQEVFDRTNGEDDPYTLDLPTPKNIARAKEHLIRLAEIAHIDIEQLQSRIRWTCDHS